MHVHDAIKRNFQAKIFELHVANFVSKKYEKFTCMHKFKNSAGIISSFYKTGEG